MDAGQADWTLAGGLVGYLLLMLAVGFYSYRYMRSLDDFVLGGRRLGPWVTAVSERASGESAWFLLGLPGAAYAAGFREYWSVIGIASGILASWALIARPLRRATGAWGALTLPDYFEARFQDRSRALRVVSLATILLFYTAYLSAQFVGAGVLLQATFGLDEQWGMLIGAVVVTLYTLLGGFLAVAWTDLIQGLLMAFVSVALPILGVVRMGGVDALVDALEPRGQDFLSITGGEFGRAFFFGVMLASLSWGFGYLGQPHLLTRYMAIRRTADLRRGALIAMVWVLLAYWGAAFTGIVGLGVLGPELEDAEAVMPLLAKTLLPGWLAGVVIAGAVAAMMSTADSQLLVASSTVVEDIYAKLVKPGASGRRLVLMSRVVTVALAALALLLARGSAETIYNLVAYAWTGLGSSFGPPLLLALYWRRVTRWGALAGMLTGTIGTVLWKNVEALGAFLDIKLASFVLAFAVTIVASLLTRPRQEQA